MSTLGTLPKNDTRHIGLAILGVMFGLLLSMLDGFIVGTAMPTIVGELGRSDLLAWVVTAYALTTAVSTPIWGKLGDLFGRKRMYQLAVMLFIAASVLAALAPTMELLIAARALQGIGAGGLAVSAFAVIGDLVPPRERGKYQGLTAIVVATGTIGGPLAGGFITEAFGWRWAFMINLPLGIIAILWTAIFLRLAKAPQRRVRIDWLGAVLLGAAVSAIVLLTTWGGTEFAWASWQTATMIAFIVVAFVAFVRWELHTSEPLVPLLVFRNRSFTMASILGFMSGAVMFASVLYLPLFQQGVQGASASESGLQLLPMMVPVVIVSIIAGRVMTRTGRYRIFPIIGSASMIIGGALLSTMTADTTWLVTGAFMVFIGIGSGLTQQMTTTIAQNSVEQRDIGAASGIVTLLRTLGGSIAVAVFGSIAAAHTAGLTGHALAVGVAESTQIIFLIVAALSAISLLAAFAIREVPLRGRAG
ncbi:EmrB/QacA subfamily drug resistance transporter [Mycetocola sp. BIGb0189]|uniref:MDR family MFS transporter n=1 Tax=Mycetocola sp. BIGb0189 TaxID=2940604 RepID=UPI002169551F|nr:MDR family MFS transporter [Mycetocola sp. BIGb0189]MCS4275691.1 EmrB/QacA subfamily drug resistance transporter [Mycetocola sp. BIGb0189]